MISKRILPLLLLLLATCCSVFAEEEQEKAETLDEKNEQSALIQAQFDYSFDDISDKLVAIKHEKGLGHGFTATMDGKIYLFTNQHIILGADKLSFSTVSGEKLRPRRVELSTSRDIARLLLSDETKGFEITRDMPMDSAVGLFGCSETDDEITTELYGTVTGVGAEIVEVSAEFTTENSGSPILNLHQEVLGIASYVRKSNRHAMKEGTKFENRTRRFGYRLTGNQWQSVNWKKYNAKYGKFYRQNALFTDGVIEVLTHWGDTPRDRISVVENPEKSLISWVASHNQIIETHGRSSQKKRFASEYSESLKTLSENCSSRARQIRLFSDKHKLTGFLRDELSMQAFTLDDISTIFIHIGNRAKDYR